MRGKGNPLQKLGLILVLLSCVLLIGSELLALYNRARVEKLTEQILLSLPDSSEGDPENYSDPRMPVLQLEGADFSGLIQVPSFGVTLPMGSDWDPGLISRYPCRFWGSAYDHSLILGGSSRKGQFDFCSRLDLGDRILVTDMTGARFSYEVVRIDRREQVDLDVFRETESHLTLFTRDETSGSYIVVSCIFSASQI